MQQISNFPKSSRNISSMQTEALKVIFDDTKVNPKCPHGPTLLLQQTTFKGTKLYYSCSAYRSRKFCSFHYAIEKDLSSIAQYLKDQENMHRPVHSHLEYMKRLATFLTYQKHNQSFCQTCSLLLLVQEKQNHLKKHHIIIQSVDLKIQYPTFLLSPLTDNKALAQYHFSEETICFLILQLKLLKFSRVLCIGCPRIHENILSQHVNELETLLLDIDHRLMQFNTNKQFCQYNLFNHWFFNNTKAEKMFETFVCKNNGDGLVIILDPPFGGLIDAISNSLNKICKLWNSTCNKGSKEIPVLWFFPYFHEKRILNNHKSMQMLDYQVDYENQNKYKRRMCGSPIRIFTNLKPSSFTLLKEIGYKFCPVCQKYVSKQNQHCVWCNNCPSKNGARYTHCVECGICVKSTYKHCPSCQRCHIPSYHCKKQSITASLCYNKKDKRKKKNSIRKKKWQE